MAQVRACSKSVLGGKIRPVTPMYSFRLYARAALAWTEEKRSLRNEHLKANRASEERKAEDKTRKGNGRPQETALGHSQNIAAG